MFPVETIILSANKALDYTDKNNPVIGIKRIGVNVIPNEMKQTIDRPSKYKTYERQCSMENRLTDSRVSKTRLGELLGNVRYSQESGARLSDGNERKVARKVSIALQFQVTYP